MPEYPKTPIQKFNVPGQEAIGRFEGLRPGKFKNKDGSPQMLIQIGKNTYGSSKVLNDKFTHVPVGSEWRVVYKGMRAPKQGSEQTFPYKDFEITPLNAATVPFVAPECRMAEDTTDYAQPSGGADLEYNLEFLLLLSRVKKHKGEHIANILKSACELSNDPMEALVSALTQMGAAELLT